MSFETFRQGGTCRAHLAAARGASVARQMEMFRLAKRDHGLDAKVLSQHSGVHSRTIKKWANGDSAMDLWAFNEIAKYLPDYLASIAVEPSGRRLETLEEGEGCYRELGQETLLFNTDLLSDDAPHRIREKLRDRARRILSVAARCLRSHALPQRVVQ